MNIRTQAYLLVLLPVTVASVFMLCLMDSLSKLDRALEAELHARNVIQRVGDLNSNLWMYFSEANLLHVSPDMTGLRAYQEKLRWFDEKCGELKALAAKDSQTNAEISAFIDGIKDTTTLLEKIAEVIARPSNGTEESAVPILIEKLSTGGPLLHEIESRLANLQALRKTIDQSYSQVIAEFQPRASRERSKLSKIVIVGTCINIAIALLLAALFGMRIVGRLDRLMINIQKFANRESNLEEIKGKDEIALVNKAFREVADARMKSDEFKNLVVSMVSHDLRSPLQSVSGFFSMSMDGTYGQLSPQLGQLFKQANADSVALCRTVNDLLELQKLDNRSMQLAIAAEFVESLVQRAFNELKDLAQALNVKLQTSITPELTVKCDHDRIVQVLVRFLTNAVKCSPADSIIRVSAVKGEEGVRVHVFDRGPGISEDEQLHAFDQFAFGDSSSSRSKRQIGGATLHLCKSIIEAHGGAVGAASDSARGNCFWLEIPDDSTIV
jgi:signal transduction histidine kinase